MPVNAERCPECKTFKGWRRKIQGGEVVLALIVALLSILGAVAPASYTVWNNRSDTYTRVLGSDTIKVDGDPNVPVILVLAANKGGRPSLVRSGRLVSAAAGIGETPMTIANPTDRLVPASGTTIIKLTTLDINTDLKQTDILKKLNAAEIKVILDVEETGRLGGQFIGHPDDKAKGAIIAALVQRRVSQ